MHACAFDTGYYTYGLFLEKKEREKSSYGASVKVYSALYLYNVDYKYVKIAFDFF